MGVKNTTALAESLSVPLQQLARVATISDDLSAEEQNFIDDLILSWSEYQAGISDVVKASLNQDYLKCDPLGALLMWFKIGIEHPLTYIESLLVGTYGYWYPCTSALDLGGFAFHPYFETPSTMLWLDPDVYVTVEHHSLVPAAGRVYEDAVVDHVWEKVPVLSTLMNSGAVIWPTIVLIGLQIICLSEKKKTKSCRAPASIVPS